MSRDPLKPEAGKDVKTVAAAIESLSLNESEAPDSVDNADKEEPEEPEGRGEEGEVGEEEDEAGPSTATDQRPADEPKHQKKGDDGHVEEQAEERDEEEDEEVEPEATPCGQEFQQASDSLPSPTSLPEPPVSLSVDAPALPSTRATAVIPQATETEQESKAIQVEERQKRKETERGKVEADEGDEEGDEEDDEDGDEEDDEDGDEEDDEDGDEEDDEDGDEEGEGEGEGEEIHEKTERVAREEPKKAPEHKEDNQEEQEQEKEQEKEEEVKDKEAKEKEQQDTLIPESSAASTAQPKISEAPGPRKLKQLSPAEVGLLRLQCFVGSYIPADAAVGGSEPLHDCICHGGGIDASCPGACKVFDCKSCYPPLQTPQAEATALSPEPSAIDLPVSPPPPPPAALAPSQPAAGSLPSRPRALKLKKKGRKFEDFIAARRPAKSPSR